MYDNYEALKERIERRRKLIRTLKDKGVDNALLNGVEGSVYEDMKKFTDFSNHHDTPSELMIALKVLMWHKALTNLYSEIDIFKEDKDWESLLKELLYIGQNPSYGIGSLPRIIEDAMEKFSTELMLCEVDRYTDDDNELTDENRSKTLPNVSRLR